MLICSTTPDLFLKENDLFNCARERTRCNRGKGNNPPESDRKMHERFNREARTRKIIVLPVSHSGVAVNLLPNGCTAHRKFGTPIEVSDVRKFLISPDSAEDVNDLNLTESAQLLFVLTTKPSIGWMEIT
ncbi:hypothetical protein CRE_06301 [Caenorhabditis remanei]|uniref:ATP-dependent DNA helicase n=1 Tax=Caenorhabditis remanei TaxID=31234 RepID=E3M137_CAERE|nr:hypothetical protein CRE_06301 [Caenorhabditis remanei]